MAEETILQNWIFTKFLFPFLLVFFIVFAILERTKLFGESKKQLNALTAFVIGLTFVVAVYPTLVVTNMILFLTIALVCVFVILLIWGFIFGDVKEGFKPEKWMKWLLGALTGIIFIGAVIWATGFWKDIGSFLNKELTQNIITNAVFIIVIAIALALILIGPKKKD